MARPLRVEFDGALYHVTSRGNAGEAIFDDDGDRKVFLEILGRAVNRFNWLCHAYCLMNNHYHLVIETPEANRSVLLGSGLVYCYLPFCCVIGLNHGSSSQSRI